MTAPSFQIDQPTGAGSGTAGLSRKDLWLSKALNLTCTNPPGGAAFTWTILYAPSGSSAAIINPNNVVANFTPDVLSRSFRMALQINAGGPGLYFTFIVACTYSTSGILMNRGWRTPAQNEQNDEANFGGNLYGYAPDYDNIILDIVANAQFTSGGGTGYVYVTPSLSPYTVIPGILHVDADVGGAGGPAPILVALPAVPTLMQTITISDPYGAATPTNSITVEGNGNQIDGQSTYVIAVSYGRVTVRFNGLSWEAVY